MRVALPHDLGRDEVRRRLKERSHEIAGYLPGGMANVETDWVGDDLFPVSANGTDLRL